MVWIPNFSRTKLVWFKRAFQSFVCQTKWVNYCIFRSKGTFINDVTQIWPQTDPIPLLSHKNPTIRLLNLIESLIDRHDELFQESIPLHNHELILSSTSIMRSQLKIKRGKILLPDRDLNHGPFKLKASVLPMSYADPFILICSTVGIWISD